MNFVCNLFPAVVQSRYQLSSRGPVLRYAQCLLIGGNLRWGSRRRSVAFCALSFRAMLVEIDRFLCRLRSTPTRGIDWKGRFVEQQLPSWCANHPSFFHVSEKTFR